MILVVNDRSVCGNGEVRETGVGNTGADGPEPPDTPLEC